VLNSFSFYKRARSFPSGSRRAGHTGENENHRTRQQAAILWEKTFLPGERGGVVLPLVTKSASDVMPQGKKTGKKKHRNWGGTTNTTGRRWGHHQHLEGEKIAFGGFKGAPRPSSAGKPKSRHKKTQATPRRVKGNRANLPGDASAGNNGGKQGVKPGLTGG